MNEDWLTQIRDRMTEYESAEPDGLWSAIEEKLADRDSLQHKAGAPFMSFRNGAIAAAAALAVAIPAGIYLLHKPDFEIAKPVFPGYLNIISQNKYLTPIPGESLIAQTSSREISEIERILSRHNENTVAPSEHKTDISFSENDKTTSDTSYANTNTPLSGVDGFSEPKQNVYSLSTKNTQKGRLEISAYTSGAGLGSFQSTHYPASASDASIGGGNSDWVGNPKLGMLLYNHGRSTEKTVNHRLPVRTGLSVAYSLTERIALESGITYTNLTSDFTEGSEEYYLSGNQELQYLGIPLNLKYQIYSWNFIDFYATAGGALDKCISARSKEKYIFKDKTVSSETQHIDEKPLQWSVSASLGIQCRFIKKFSIYAEPGISYYFDDGTSVKTIYKEKPLNFSLNIGIRYTFGK